MENKVHHLHEAMREKNKLLYKREYDKSKREDEMLENDIEFLDKIDSKFDPLDSFFKSKSKRAKYE